MALQVALIPIALILVTCAVVGIIGNSLMVLCIVNTKKFRNPCHVLIAITCLADALHLSGHIPFAVHFFGNLTSTQSQCYFMLIGPIIGFTASGPLCLAMGIDRLIAVKCPSRYRFYHNHPNFYIMAQLVFPTIYCSTFLFYGYEMRDDEVVVCANPVALRGSSFEMFTYSNLAIDCLIMLIYLTVFLMLRDNKTSKNFKSVFRCIAITVFIVLFCWFFTTITNTLSYHTSDDLNVVILIQMYAGASVNIAAASNIFVFYAINHEYRVVIRHFLGIQKMTVASARDMSVTMGVTLAPKKMTML